MKKLKAAFSLTFCSTLVSFFIGNALAEEIKEIIHDAEYYVLESQYGEKWVAEDKASTLLGCTLNLPALRVGLL